MHRSASHGGGLGGGLGSPGEDARTLLRLLGGQPPRRAVVGEGGVLCDRVDSPGSTEVGSVSAVCEVVRRMAGLPVWSRDSAQLVQQCLDTNDPGAWRALYCDVTTEDVDWPRLRAQVLAGGGARVCVGCLLAPRDAAHLLHVTACLAAMMADDETTRREFSAALGCKLVEFVDVLMRHNSVMRRDVRDGVLTALGRMLAKADAPVADVAAALDRVLDRRHDDMVRLFTHLPVAECVALVPGLVPKLVARARVAAASSQYALLAALARASAGSPRAVEPHQSQIADLVSATLATQLAGNQLDARTTMVCGMLAGSAGPATSGGLAPLLAQALQRAAALLVEKTAASQ
jgi:hypothetical protein